MNDTQRCKIVNEIVEFMLQSFELPLNKKQKQATADAAIVLFPALEYKLDETDKTVR